MSRKIEYCELDARSNFSFLQGASHAEELVSTAAALGYHSLGIADLHTMAGVVRAHHAANLHSFRCFPGTRVRCVIDLEKACTTKDPKITPVDRIDYELLVYPYSHKGYAALCNILTLGKRRAPKDECYLTLEELLLHACEWVVLAVHAPLSWPPRAPEALCNNLGMLRESLGSDSFYLALSRNYQQQWLPQQHMLVEAAQKASVPLVATNAVCYHHQERALLQDVLTCIREGRTIYTAGTLLQQNAERYLKTLHELQHLFRDIPHAVKATIEIAERLKGFSLTQLEYHYPKEVYPQDQSADEYLKHCTWKGAHDRFPEGVPLPVAHSIRQELALIKELDYAKYFLTCYDIVCFARSRDILCQGRGSAANSAVCFCLGITNVRPDKIDLLFARFVSKERNEPPDIDIDFEHERREEVIAYIYKRYGRHRAGLTATVITYRHRSALREVSKVMGFPPDMVDLLCKSLHRWTACELDADELAEIGLAPDDPHLLRTLQLVQELLSFPRHLSQHVGGFIISEHPLTSLVPIRNTAMESRTIIEWDKDDIEVLGMLKIDILALGMLTCLRKALLTISQQRAAAGLPALRLDTVPSEDPAVYDMICAADTLGVFQIESRAQMSMLPRLKPRCFYDLVIEVAIVRPGPIQGNMVHPYLRRRSGKEPCVFPDERVAKILGKTLGVPLFQEQAMRLAIVLAGFTPGEAEQLRKAMAAWKRNKEAIAHFKARIIKGMTENGYSVAFAEHCLHQIQGFSEYGFPESHAASFAYLVYASCWVKHHHPAHFAAALLNSQPMGFYRPSQIIQDAKRHGVQVAPISLHYSQWDCRLEHTDLATDSDRTTTRVKHPTLRLGRRLIKGLLQEQCHMITETLNSIGKVTSIEQLWYGARHTLRKALQRKTLRQLAQADAFSELGLSRREALWNVKALPTIPLPLDNALPIKNTPAALPDMSLQQEIFSDYGTTGISLKGHPFERLRPTLQARSIHSYVELRKLNPRRKHTVRTAGMVLFRQRPGTAKGTVFVTLEDETGMVNLLIRPEIFEQRQSLIIHSSALLVEGTTQFIGPLVYVAVKEVWCIEEMLEQTAGNEGESKVLPEARSYSY